MADACKEVGLTPAVVRRYTEVASKNYLSAQDPEPGFGITTQEMGAVIEEVSNKADQLCSVPELAAKGAALFGYVTEAASLDAYVPLSARQDQVEANYRRFLVLADLGKADKGRWGRLVPTVMRDVDFVTDQWFAWHTSASTTVPPEQPPVLKQVYEEVLETTEKDQKPLVVFDLDDTLFSPAGRNVRILQETTEKSLDLLPPDKLASMMSVRDNELVYDLQTDLQARFNIDPVIYHDFLDRLKGEWPGKFFSSEYSKEDPPYAGAPEYVAHLAAAGGVIVYFTGRQGNDAPGTQPGMRPGTLEALQQRGFPIPDGKRALLFMKPDINMVDLEYKQATLDTIDALGTVVAAFDNEPSGDAMYAKRWPQATVVRVGRCRAPNPKVTREPDQKERPVRLQDLKRLPDSVQWVQDFQLNGTKLAHQ